MSDRGDDLENIVNEMEAQSLFVKNLWAAVAKLAPENNRTRDDILSALEEMSRSWHRLSNRKKGKT